MKTRIIGFFALIALLGILVGLPWLLVTVAGSPIPASIPTSAQLGDWLTRPDDGTLALGVLKYLGWLVWLFLAVCLAIEIYAHLRGIQAPQLPGLRAPQGAARHLVAAAAALLIAVPLTASPVPTASALPSGMAQTATPTTTPTLVEDQTPTPVEDETPATEEAKTIDHVVTPPDTLSRLAKTYLADADRWPEIFEASKGIQQPDGRYLTDPDLIVDGWTLRIPVTTTNAEAVATIDHVVTSRDTLTRLAKTYLGDADRWPEIFEASKGIQQLDGRYLTDPDLILVGWTLKIPAETTADATAPAAATTPETEPPAADPAADQPAPDSSPATPTESAPSAPQATEAPATAAQPPAVTASAERPEATASASRQPSATVTAEPTEASPSVTQQPSVSASASASSAPVAPQRSVTGSAEPSPDASAAETQTPTVTHPTAGMDAPWLLTGLTMGGAVLAGSALMMLKRRREQQFRARRPGRAIAAPDPVLAPVAKTIATAGSVSAPTVRFMDEALRRLATTQLSSGDAMPAVVAVQLTDDAMVLHLDTAMELDDPWECDDSAGLRWRLAHDTALGDVGAADEGQPAPYPLLVTSGTSDNGDLWLLNFERLATVRVTGDTTFGHDFLRYLAAELAVNPWSRDAKITCVGVASEVQPMNPERFSPTTSIERASADVLADAVATLTRARQAGTDTATARSGQFADEAWGARLMIIDAESAQNQTLRRLVVIVEAQPTMTATAVVVGGETDAVSGPELRFSPQGRVTLTHIGLDLVAVGLTSDEARGCAALLEHSELAGDTPMPTTANAEDGWRSLSDDAGALRDELTVPRTVPDHDLIEPASSLLDTDDTTLPPVAPEEDLAELDPKVPVHVREEVEQSDPTLDVDVAHWFSSQCDRPRLALLGPVSVRAHGAPIAKRKPYYTEVLAYIALRENGASSDEISDAFGHAASTTRSSVKKVRDWLGINPRTREWHLPEATRSKAAQQRGVPVYQVEDLLVDVDLFRRLRLRGQARGVEGISDLVTALRLVNGRPFDQIRPGGWSWLVDLNTDNHMICAIVDVAHILSIHFLQKDELEKARAATETALLAAPFDTIPKLDLAAVTKAEGHLEEARRIVHDHVCNVPDENGVPMEVGERVEQILASLDWLDARAS